MPRSLYGAVADSEYLTAWIRRSPWSRDGDPEEHLRGVARQVAGYFLADRLARTGKKMAGDKTPLISTEVVKEIAEMFPESKVIHIIRDGRDVAVSSMHHIWNNALDRGGHHELKPEILSKRDRYRADPAGFVASAAVKRISAVSLLVGREEEQLVLDDRAAERDAITGLVEIADRDGIAFELVARQVAVTVAHPRPAMELIGAGSRYGVDVAGRETAVLYGIR